MKTNSRQDEDNLALLKQWIGNLIHSRYIRYIHSQYSCHIRSPYIRYVHSRKVAYERHDWDRRVPRLDCEMTLSEASEEYTDPTEVFRYVHHYFLYRCPQIIRDHRIYFAQWDSGFARGLGTDAFQAMWWLLMLEHQPVKCLEIGVYRGQVISLWALIAKYLHRSSDVHGISPLSSTSDGINSPFVEIDYEADILKNFSVWDLPKPTLVKSLSTDKAAVAHIANHSWDLVYIDGNHTYEICLADYRICHQNLRDGGILVIDDAAVETRFRPPLFYPTAGLTGPSRVAREVASKEMRFLYGIGHNLVFQKI